MQFGRAGPKARITRLASKRGDAGSSLLPRDLPSLGPLPRLGWMDKAQRVVDGVLDTVPSHAGLDRPQSDWRSMRASLMQYGPPSPDDLEVRSLRAVLAIVWREAHNAGYYTNSYTAGVTPQDGLLFVEKEKNAVLFDLG